MLFLSPIDVTKPYKFIGFGVIDVTKPYKFIGFGDIDGPQPPSLAAFCCLFHLWHTSTLVLVYKSLLATLVATIVRV